MTGSDSSRISGMSEEEIRYEVVKKLLKNNPNGTDIALILKQASLVMEFLEKGTLEQTNKKNGRENLSEW